MRPDSGANMSMKENLLLDDWGPVPDPPVSPRDGLRAAGEALLVAACLTLGLLGLVVVTVLYLVALATALCAFLLVELFRLCRNVIGSSRAAPAIIPAPTPATSARDRASRTAVAVRPGSPACNCGRCGRDLRGKKAAPCLACDRKICARCMSVKGAPQLCSDCEDDWYAGDIDMGSPSPPGYGS
jgi:hypothetical protein